MQLELHQVEAGDHLRDRVLHLEPGVHLEEEGLALSVHQELEGAGVAVAGASGQGHRHLPHARAQLCAHERRRALLEHLLVAPLQRALPLEEVDGVAVRVGQHLDLDVAGSVDDLLEIDGGVPEGAQGFARRALQGRGQVLGAGHQTQALSAPARRGLDHHREADLRRAQGDARFVGERLHGPRHHGHARGPGRAPGRGLLAHEGDGLAAGDR